MGAWGHRVMDNDSALDYIGDFVYSDNLEQFIKEFMHKDNEYYIYEMLLAVEIVDISLNGIDMDILGSTYEYEDWFDKLPNHPMENLRDDAIIVIKHIITIENAYGGWVEDCKKDRKDILKRILSRLEN